MLETNQDKDKILSSSHLLQITLALLFYMFASENGKVKFLLLLLELVILVGHIHHILWVTSR